MNRRIAITEFQALRAAGFNCWIVRGETTTYHTSFPGFSK